MKNSEKTLEMIVNLCKNRGYVYAGSEIYGGLANSWDYGPLGVEFKNNVKKAWLKKFVQESDYNVGLDAAIIMNPTTWVTTGHHDGAGMSHDGAGMSHVGLSACLMSGPDTSVSRYIPSILTF